MPRPDDVALTLFSQKRKAVHALRAVFTTETLLSSAVGALSSA